MNVLNISQTAHTQNKTQLCSRNRNLKSRHLNIWLTTVIRLRDCQSTTFTVSQSSPLVRVTSPTLNVGQASREPFPLTGREGFDFGAGRSLKSLGPLATLWLVFEAAWKFFLNCLTNTLVAFAMMMSINSRLTDWHTIPCLWTLWSLWPRAPSYRERVAASAACDDLRTHHEVAVQCDGWLLSNICDALAATAVERPECRLPALPPAFDYTDSTAWKTPTTQRRLTFNNWRLHTHRDR